MDPEQIDSVAARFKFSIWDLAVLTAFVAVVFAIPGGVTQVLVVGASVALFLVAMLLFFSIFSARRRVERPARAERFLIKILLRGFLYSAAMVIVGTTAIVMKLWAK